MAHQYECHTKSDVQCRYNTLDQSRRNQMKYHGVTSAINVPQPPEMYTTITFSTWNVHWGMTPEQQYQPPTSQGGQNFLSLMRTGNTYASAKTKKKTNKH